MYRMEYRVARMDLALYSTLPCGEGDGGERGERRERRGERGERGEREEREDGMWGSRKHEKGGGGKMEKRCIGVSKRTKNVGPDVSSSRRSK